MDSGFMMGAWVLWQERKSRQHLKCHKRKGPGCFFTASGGARMQEDAFPDADGKTSAAVARFHEEGLLYICLDSPNHRRRYRQLCYLG